MPNFQINTNLTDSSVNSLFTAEMISAYVKTVRADSPLTNPGYVKMIVDAANKYGINALWVISHGCLESSWFTSPLCRSKNNAFGIGAWDRNPDDAFKYDSIGDCIDWYCNFIKTKYLNPTGQWWGGASTPQGMNVHYASDKNWALKIVTIMNQFGRYINSQTPVIETPPSKEVGAYNNPNSGQVTTIKKEIVQVGVTGAPGYGSLSEIAKTFNFPDYGKPSGWDKVLSWNKHLWTGDYNVIPKNNPVYREISRVYVEDNGPVDTTPNEITVRVGYDQAGNEVKPYDTLGAIFTRTYGRQPNWAAWKNGDPNGDLQRMIDYIKAHTDPSKGKINGRDTIYKNNLLQLPKTL